MKASFVQIFLKLTINHFGRINILFFNKVFFNFSFLNIVYKYNCSFFFLQILIIISMKKNILLNIIHTYITYLNIIKKIHMKNRINSFFYL